MQRRFRPARRRRAGFTLLEVLLVLVILVILGSFATVQLRNARRRALVDQARVQISNFKEAIMHFEQSIGQFPSSLDDLVTPPSDLADPTKWGPEPYLTSGTVVPLDPWENAYKYEPPAEGEYQFRIWSSGPDGADGTNDDISNLD